jgi:mono/diheme cytochrome c family protein
MSKRAWLRLAGLALALGSALPVLAHRVPSKVPREAAARTNPLPKDEGTIRAGRGLYEKHCLSCHGSTGEGNGPQAKNLEHPPPEFAQVARTQTDGELFWKTAEGGGQMPSYRESLTEKELWQVVRYLRLLPGLQKKAPPSTAPRTGDAAPAQERQPS